MKKSVLKQWVLVGVLTAIYAVTLLVVWIVQTKGADTRLRGLMESCVNTAVDSVDYNVEPEALRIARILVSEWRSAENAAHADLLATLEHYDCEEINIVGTNNVIVAAAEPAYVGFDMATKPETAEFSGLNTGALDFVTQHFRRSRCGRSKSKGGMGLWLKYVGLPFPEGGYLQLGDSYRNFHTRFQRALERLMQGTHAVETGYYLLVDRSSRKIISGFKPEWTDRPLDAAGTGFKTLVDDGRIRTMEVFGVASYVRRVRLEFAEMDIYVVIPVSDILCVRNWSFALTAIALGLVMLVGGILFCKVIRQHERIEDLFAREAERIEKDLVMAKSIQSNSLPSVFPPYPNLAGVIDIHAVMRPAREVGGDFYDFYFVGAKKLALVIADVSGKGVPAALFMMRAKATVQSLLKSGLGIVEAVGQANHRLAKSNDANMFVTAWIGIVDLASGEVEFVNAGHNPPVVKRADGSVEYLKAKSGPPLAAVDGVAFRRQRLTLAPGDGIVLYTDGVTEATDRAEALYGDGRLLATMRGLVGVRDSQSVIGGIMRDVDAFAGGAEQTDDITLLAFKLVARTT